LHAWVGGPARPFFLLPSPTNYPVLCNEPIKKDAP
jgi:hypothetical protein